MIDFYIKRGDIYPAVSAQLVDSAGVVIPLSGAAVVFNYRLKTTTGQLITKAVTITSAANGNIQYQWVTGDTSTVGIYEGEFVTTFANSGQLSFPEDTPFLFEVLSDIN